MTSRIALILILLTTLACPASVVLTMRAHNPSELETQETSVKQYLPKGVEREHILEAGDFDVRYDDVREQYYVQQRVELAPQETKVFEVEIEDIWLVDEEQLEYLERRAIELDQKLEGQAYAVQARNIRERVVRTINEIRARQEAARIPEASVSEHISAYNHNRVLLDGVKDDVNTLEELLNTLGSERVIKKVPKEMPPNLGTIWKTIFAIITFIAIMSAVFFLIWTRQLRKIREAENLEES